MPSRDRTPAADQGSPADGSTTRQSNPTNDTNAASGGAKQPRRRSRRRRRPRRRAASSTPPTSTSGQETAAGEDSGTPSGGAQPATGTGRRKRRRRRRGSGGTGQPAAAGAETTTDTAAEQPVPKKRRRRRAQTPPPGQIRGRRRTRSGRIEEVSSGGLVVDVRDDEVLGVLIGKHDRRGRLIWSLPKGHVELGETLEQTAVREIEEETGVSSEVRHRLGEVDYWFMLHGEKIHKTVHHFLLRYVAGELSDRDREVVEVAWVPLDEIPQRLAHPDERRLVAQVPGLLARSDA